MRASISSPSGGPSAGVAVGALPAAARDAASARTGAAGDGSTRDGDAVRVRVRADAASARHAGRLARLAVRAWPRLLSDGLTDGLADALADDGASRAPLAAPPPPLPAPRALRVCGAAARAVGVSLAKAEAGWEGATAAAGLCGRLAVARGGGACEARQAGGFTRGRLCAASAHSTCRARGRGRGGVARCQRGGGGACFIPGPSPHRPADGERDARRGPNADARRETEPLALRTAARLGACPPERRGEAALTQKHIFCVFETNTHPVKGW